MKILRVIRGCFRFAFALAFFLVVAPFYGVGWLLGLWGDDE